MKKEIKFEDLKVGILVINSDNDTCEVCYINKDKTVGLKYTEDNLVYTSCLDKDSKEYSPLFLAKDVDFTLEHTFNSFEDKLNSMLVGKRITVTDAPTDLPDDLKGHTGIVKCVNLFADTYDSVAVSSINFEDGANILICHHTPITIHNS